MVSEVVIHVATCVSEVEMIPPNTAQDKNEPILA